MKINSMIEIERRVMLAALLICSACTSLFAQGPPPPGGGDDPGMDVPIDGGLKFLILAGIFYGTKKIIDSRRKAHRTIKCVAGK